MGSVFPSFERYTSLKPVVSTIQNRDDNNNIKIISQSCVINITSQSIMNYYIYYTSQQTVIIIIII